MVFKVGGVQPPGTSQSLRSPSAEMTTPLGETSMAWTAVNPDATAKG